MAARLIKIGLALGSLWTAVRTLLWWAGDIQTAQELAADRGTIVSAFGTFALWPYTGPLIVVAAVGYYVYREYRASLREFDIRCDGDDLRETGTAADCGLYVNRKVEVTNSGSKPMTGVQLKFKSMDPPVAALRTRLPVALWPQRADPHPEHKFSLSPGESKIIGVFGTCSDHPSSFKLWHMEGYAFPSLFPRGEYKITLEVRADGITANPFDGRLWIEGEEPRITLTKR